MRIAAVLRMDCRCSLMHADCLDLQAESWLLSQVSNRNVASFDEICSRTMKDIAKILLRLVVVEMERAHLYFSVASEKTECASQ